MNYLKYIEHSAENLQFFLWFQDYSARFDKLPASERALAPEWTRSQAEAEASGNTTRPKRMDPRIAAVLKGTDFADGPQKPIIDKVDPFKTPSKSSEEEKRDVMSDYGSSMSDEKTLMSSNVHQSVAEQAFDDAGIQWKPCTSPNICFCRSFS